MVHKTNVEDMDDENEGGDLDVELPDKNGLYKDAILPNVLRNLVHKRKQVKQKMKTERPCCISVT